MSVAKQGYRAGDGIMLEFLGSAIRTVLAVALVMLAVVLAKVSQDCCARGWFNLASSVVVVVRSRAADRLSEGLANAALVA